MILIGRTLLLLAIPTLAIAENLVVNGSFEDGNTGFDSDYQFGLNNVAGYTVTDNPRTLNGLFTSIGDNTTGDGLFLVANGSADTDDRVWFQTIDVVADIPVQVELFATLVFRDSELPLTVEVDGVEVATLDLASFAVGQFGKLEGQFTPDASGPVLLSIRSLDSGAGGNDFAIDDISAVQVPESSSITLLIAVLGGVLNRKRSA